MIMGSAAGDTDSAADLLNWNRAPATWIWMRPSNMDLAAGDIDWIDRMITKLAAGVMDLVAGRVPSDMDSAAADRHLSRPTVKWIWIPTE